MPLPIKKIKPRRSCTPDRLRKMKELGVKTTGFDLNMEKILTQMGYGLPTHEGDYFGFKLNGKYQYHLFNYADALAELIILLKQLGEI